jgi:lipopolysaccharide transport system permease protein
MDPGDDLHGPRLDPAVRTIRLEPRRKLARLDLAEVWRARELIALLAMREVRVRYKQTALGVAWAVVVPLVQMVVFTLVVAVLFGLSAPEGVPFPLFNFAGLVPWAFFSQAVVRGTSSLVARSAMIKKVYLPRIAIPLSAIVTALIDFAISFVLLLGLLVVFHWIGPVSLGATDFPAFTWRPGWHSLLALPMLGLTILTATGVVVWSSALMVRFRDVGLVVPFVLQVWMYACPIIYSLEELPGWLVPWYALNPMVGVIEGFRWALLGIGEPPVVPTLIAAGLSVAVLVSGLLFFRRTERTFADIL